jgi:hypothetical protein
VLVKKALVNIRTTDVEAGHGFSSAALEISVNLGPALLPLHCQTDKRRQREMNDRGCAEELIEVY